MWFLGIFWVTEIFVIWFISVSHSLPMIKEHLYLWGISSYSRCTEISQVFRVFNRAVETWTESPWAHLKWHVPKELSVKRSHCFLLDKTLNECVWPAGAVLRTLEQTCLSLDPRVIILPGTFINVGDIGVAVVMGSGVRGELLTFKEECLKQSRM